MNEEIANILRALSYYLEMENVPFKPQAYQKASQAIQTMAEDVQDIYSRGGLAALKEISGVGESIAKKIEEYIKTKHIKEFDEYQKRIPVDIFNLIDIEGLGPKTIYNLYQYLKIKTRDDLEKAALNGQIRNLPGFGAKSEENILKNLNFQKEPKRYLFAEIESKWKKLENFLKSTKAFSRIDIAGSFRRKKETIGDMDILVASQSSNLKTTFKNILVKLKPVRIWALGETKVSFLSQWGFDVDIRLVKDSEYAAALLYFTGSKDHNIKLRELFMKKGYKLNEYGLFKTKNNKEQIITVDSEKAIYSKLGLDYIEPELRENTGEIEAAKEHRLPRLVNLSDIGGDFHIHTPRRKFVFDGQQEKEIIYKYINLAQQLGYKYLGISNHTNYLKIEYGLSEEELIQEHKLIEKINNELQKRRIDFFIFHGCEANVLKDGTLDISDKVLKELDYVIASVHSHFKLSKTEQTKRIVKAIKNPNVDILGHPTGRLINQRPEYEVDLEALIDACQKTKTILEINASPFRLDLNDVSIKEAIHNKIQLIINSDSHQIDQLNFMKYGVYQARRGWAEAPNILNTFNQREIQNFFKYH